ncbi:RidA family protein [Priestia megaterium]|uniref:RidA family protein n=1 Tax=Priestia megaterium TaxID=1404 RepID=UPI0035D60CF9
MNKKGRNFEKSLVEERLKFLELDLPRVSKPLHCYSPIIIHNKIAYISGQVPRINGTLPYHGKVGEEVSIDEARHCAELCVLKALSYLKQELKNLDSVEQILQVTGYVQSASNFSQQSIVIDATSELLENIYGEIGQHSRTAVGVNELPSNSPVEISFVIAVK